MGGLRSGLGKIRAVSRAKGGGGERGDDLGMNLRSGKMKTLSWEPEAWVVGGECKISAFGSRMGVKLT